MSGKAGGEATATVYTALEGMDKRDLEPKVQKKVQKLIKALKNLVNDPRRTKGGDISDYLNDDNVKTYVQSLDENVASLKNMIEND